MTSPPSQILMPDPDTLLDRLRAPHLTEGDSVDTVFRSIATTVGGLPMTPHSLANLLAGCLLDYLDSAKPPPPAWSLLEVNLRDVWLPRIVDDPRFLTETQVELDGLTVLRVQ